ncbi:MAG: hypothetical protein MJA83_11150 [Gammaproteobacteria bacterium]|nr:hypothetical protein [Gammaproteobacteria bacterium]
MDLIKRYVRSVGIQLPAKQRRDVESELQSLIEDAVEAKQEEIGRELNETELAEVIKTFGHPMRAAAGYLGNHGLIGPELFPLYKLILMISFSIIAIVYVLGFLFPALTFSSPVSLGIGVLFSLPLEIGHAMLISFAIITISFAVAEREHVGGIDFFDNWNPLKLPDWKATDPAKRGEVFAEIFWLLIFLLLFNGAIDFDYFTDINTGPFGLGLAEQAKFLVLPINVIAVLWTALLVYVFVNNIWTRVTRSMNLILNILAFGILLVLMTQSPLLDLSGHPELVEQMSVAPEMALRAVLGILALFILYDGVTDAYKLFMQRDEDAGE